MPRIIYNAPPGHHYVHPEVEFDGDQVREVSDDLAEELLTDPNADFAEAPDEEPEDLSKLTREVLNDRLRATGYQNPEGLPNKPAVIAAIKESEADQGDEPEDGEGREANPEHEEDS